MNDTHGTEGRGWYGFDLDGTLAKYDGWKGIDHIGEPVAPMVDRLRKMHAEGKVVKIMTARVAPRANAEYKDREKCAPPDYVAEAGRSDYAISWAESMYLSLDKWGAREFIVDWCLKNLGFLPEITHEKDHLMLELYDDRVKQVVPNEGRLVEDIAEEERVARRTERAKRAACKRYEMVSSFLLGMLVMALLVFAIQDFLFATLPVHEAERTEGNMK